MSYIAMLMEQTVYITNKTLTGGRFEHPGGEDKKEESP